MHSAINPYDNAKALSTAANFSALAQQNIEAQRHEVLVSVLEAWYKFFSMVYIALPPSAGGLSPGNFYIGDRRETSVQDRLRSPWRNSPER